MFTSEKMVKFLREKYPPGTRIRLVSMEDPYAPVAPGTEGTLVCVDDAGQFQMKWDNGRTLALIPGEDSFTVLPPERSVLKLYMPLTAELYEPDEWGDMPEEAERLTGGELASYEDKIRSALFKNRMQEEQIRGIMYWYRKPDSVNDKVHSVVFDVEQRHGRLWGVAECQISGELSAGELATLKKYISGQASDGWGEGFEQQEITLDGGRELYVHLWQDEDWSIRTEQEQFEPYRDKLPQLCFTLLPGTGQLICVKRGESGYYPSGWSTTDAQENRRIADEQNRKLGVTPAQEEIPAEPAEVYYLSQGESFQWYGETAWVSGYNTTELEDGYMEVSVLLYYPEEREELPEMPGLEADGQLRMTEDGTILDPSAMTEKEGSVPKNGEH